MFYDFVLIYANIQTQNINAYQSQLYLIILITLPDKSWLSAISA